MKEPLIDFSLFDENKVLANREEILTVMPHRFEMQQLDAILHLDEDNAVGYKDIGEDEFWVRGHFPGRPLMPGVIICESAAQLSSYYAAKLNLVDSGYIGLGGLDNVRFRGPVLPGSRLLIMLKKRRVRPNRMFTADFQCYVQQQRVAEGIVRGVALGE